MRARFPRSEMPDRYLDGIIGEIEEHRKRGKSIVTCNGCFVMLHPAHVEFLKKASEQGNILVVGINHDEYTKRAKGLKKLPINQRGRLYIVQAIKPVSYTFVFEEDDPRKFLEIIKPDIHVNGIEYGEDCVEAGTVKRNRGRLHLVDTRIKCSTSDLLKMMSKLYEN